MPGAFNFVEESLADQAIARQEQIFIAQIQSGEPGEYQVRVNARKKPRPAVASNEFALNGEGFGKGDEVLVLTSEENDMPTILGLSPWILHGDEK